jgi:hypothetical protein
MGLTPEQSRSITRTVVALAAGVVLSWAGIVVLIVLSVLWPRDHALRILLVLWALFVVGIVTTRRQAEKPQRGWVKGQLLFIVAFAPMLPFFWAARACFRVWAGLQRR